jgi:hypothetical protein
MMPRRVAPVHTAAFGLLLLVLAPQVCRAQARVFIRDTITLDAVGNPFTGPFINSFARAILYNTSNGTRAYNTQVILGHRVWDLDAGFSLIYQGQIVSDIGYANSFADHLEGTWGHC